MPKVTTVGLEEFLEENVKEITGAMTWMKDKNMRLCESLKELRDFIDVAIQKNICALDTETTGLNTRVNKQGVPYIKIVGFCLAHDVLGGIYVPINHAEGVEYNLPEKEVFNEIQRLCSNSVVILHNAKYDLMVLKNEGIVIDQFDRFEDTLILARLYDAGQKEIGLKHLSEKLLNQPMLEFDTVTGGSKQFTLISPKICYIYAASDAVCTFGLYEFFMAQKTVVAQRAIYNLEKRTVFVVMQMEANLIYIDREYLLTERTRIQIKLEAIKKEVVELAGEDFNVGSTQQLGKILFDKLKFRYPDKEKTKSNQYKTDTKTLEKIQDEYPIVKKIIEFRGLEKALGTYIENLINNCDENSHIKMGFNQNGTDTGRFSSPGGRGIDVDGYSAVNVQSIPANYDETAPDVRKAFRAHPGNKIVAMDFSGEELRVAANLSREQKWMDEFLLGSADLHTATGKVIFKKEEISKLERSQAKCVAKGTLIASENGWIPIENLHEGDKVITSTGELKEIEKIWDMGIKPGAIINTRSGHKITCGLNHRFLSIENKWIKAKDLVKGQKLKTSDCSKMNPREIKKIHYNFWDKGNNHFISDNLPYVEINPLWARLMGYILGDGSVHIESAHVVCSDEYEDVKEDIVNVAKKLGLSPKVKRRRRKKINGKYGRWLYRIQLGSRNLVRFLNQVGFIARRSGKMDKRTSKYTSMKVFRIPRVIFESPKEVSKEFLAGLFETDGTVDGKNEMSITTKDKELAEDIILLLSSFGIKSYIQIRESKKYHRDYYKVTLNTAGSIIFEKEIGFISKKKRDKSTLIANKGLLKSYQTNWETEIKSVKFIKNVELMDLTIKGDDPTYVAQGLVTHNTVNFLVMYGGGPRGLAEQAKMSEREARRILTAFFEGLPQLDRWIKRERSLARKNKFARTEFGRLRPLHMFYDSGDQGLEAHADRCATNFKIQGVCADIMKTVMVRVSAWIKANNLQDEIKILLTMHDELVFEMPENKLKEYIPPLNNIMCLKDILQDILHWPVPLTVDAEYGDTWHVTNNFFEEYPELRDTKETVEFHASTQNIPINLPPIVQQEGIPEVLPLAEEKKSPELGVAQTIPVEAEPIQVDKEDSTEEFLYTIRSTSMSTLRKLNDIIQFLEEEKNNSVYSSSKKNLRLCDKNGESLLVSNLKIYPDAFISLARYFGI